MLIAGKVIAGLGLVAAGLVLVLVPEHPGFEWFFAALLGYCGVSVIASIDKEDLK